MITIAELQLTEIGTEIDEPMNFVIKTAGKSFKDAKSSWIQQTVLTDETGDIKADINTIKYSPLIKGNLIVLEYTIVQPAGEGQKLRVEQFSQPTVCEEPPESLLSYHLRDNEPVGEVKGKIRHWLVYGLVREFLRSGKSISEATNEILENKSEIKKLIEFVLTGK